MNSWCLVRFHASIDGRMHDTANERLYHMLNVLATSPSSQTKYEHNKRTTEKTSGTSVKYCTTKTKPQVSKRAWAFWAKCCLNALIPLKSAFPSSEMRLLLSSAQLSLTRSMLMRFICQPIHLFWAKIKKRDPKDESSLASNATLSPSWYMTHFHPIFTHCGTAQSMKQ